MGACLCRHLFSFEEVSLEETFVAKRASRLHVIADRIILVSDRQANRFASDSDVQRRNISTVQREEILEYGCRLPKYRTRPQGRQSTMIIRMFVGLFAYNTASCREQEKAGIQYEGTLRSDGKP